MENNAGFTLIELIIVISIVALLSTIGITTYSSVQVDARNSRRKSDLRELQTALEAYKTKNNYRYPSTLIGGNRYWFGTCNKWNGGFIADDSGPDGYIPNLAPDYIPKLPRDPRELKSSATCAETNSNCYLMIGAS